MTPELAPEKLALLLGLSFFFGLAFEGFYWNTRASRPGGVRTFPLLSLSGAILYWMEPQYALAFCVGLVVLGVWLYPYYQRQVAETDPEQRDRDGIMVPVCNLVAYVLGPSTLIAPPWVAVGITVTAVLLLRARDRLHGLAQKIPGQEIITVGQFLVLTGIVLPLLPNKPVTTLTTITPFQVWLAVVAVSSLSYGSYLAQRLLSPERGVFLASLLGGLYSSTAITVVLARQLAQRPPRQYELQSGIVLATGLMYLRLGVVIAVFNLALAAALAPLLLGLFVLAVFLAVLCLWHRSTGADEEHAEAPRPGNPLELSAALVFAILFVVISVASTWVESRFGNLGIYTLAAMIGVTDIDPFVLSLAQGGVTGISRPAVMVAVLIAASSNNVLKACYAFGFAGWPLSLRPALALVLLAAAGFAGAAWVANLGG